MLLTKQIVSNQNDIRSKINIGSIGMCNFVRSAFITQLKKDCIRLRCIANVPDIASKIATITKNYEYICSDYGNILVDSDVDAVFISSNQQDHTTLITDALYANKSIFCEAPLCLNKNELNRLIRLYNTLYVQMQLFPVQDSYSNGAPIFMVGYNRRFSSLVMTAKKLIGQHHGPCVINYRINAGILPDDHWLLNPKHGGGRIVGEVCHFVDFINSLTGTHVDRVFAHSLFGSRIVRNRDNVIATLMYEDGSVGTISYFAVGDQHFPRERIEIFCDGKSCIIDDFCRMTYSHGGKKQVIDAPQDKGYRNEVNAFFNAMLEGKKAPIPFEQIVETSLVTFGINESIRTGKPVFIPVMRKA